MGELPKYARFNGRLLTLSRTISHASSESMVVIGMDESGREFYASRAEWLCAAECFWAEARSEGLVTSESPAAEKIKLFRSLFRGRNDVYGHGYWSKKLNRIGYAPACANERFFDVCPRRQGRRIKCADCDKRQLLELTDRALVDHFKGKDPKFGDVVGLYLLRPDGTASTLVIDFDKRDWQKAVAVLREQADAAGIPHAVERSRSGNGAHVWFFFEEFLPGARIRDFGSALLSAAMSSSAAISFDSFDRMFPPQASIPEGSFGNLIALPFQGAAQRKGNTVFVDGEFAPYPDQWLFLSRLGRIPSGKVDEIIRSSPGGPLGSLAYDRRADAEFSGAAMSRYPGKSVMLQAVDFPGTVTMQKASMLFIPEKGLSPAARNGLLRLAAFGNPEFYRAQAMRQSVFGKPRVLCIAEERDGCIALPRGCEGKLGELLRSANVLFRVSDERYSGREIDVEFTGQLRAGQREACDRLSSYEDGILSAPTGFGKTVIGASLIGKFKMPTLIIVPKTALVPQWKEKLEQFLEINEELKPLLTPTGRKSKKKPQAIGQLGGGRAARSGIIDVATYQSLLERDGFGGCRAKSFVGEYGLVLVDECHHGAAPQLETVLKAVNPRRIYGLSATPKRADGLEAITYLLCGPIRVKIDPKEQARLQRYRRLLKPRFTGICLAGLENGSSFAQILEKICEHEKRNELITTDVWHALGEGRTALVVSKRKDHARRLCRLLVDYGCDARLLVGEGTPKQRREAIEKAKAVEDSAAVALVATESYLGEGFDMPQLDALFLATPISWGGNVTQQAGRLHREHEGKTDVVVYDYVDASIPMLERMYKKRLKTYGRLGCEVLQAMTGDEGLNAGGFVGHDTWHARFEADIRDAKHSVRVSAPYASEAAIKSLAPAIRNAASRGVSVVCALPAQKETGNGAEVRRALAKALLKSMGCAVLGAEEMPQGLAIIDESLIWYGTLPLLAFPKSDDCSLRFEDAELAGELLAGVWGEDAGIDRQSVARLL